MDKLNLLIVLREDTVENIAKLRKEAGAIEAPPTSLETWVTTNAERVGKWKNRPYWWKDNIDRVNGYLNPV